MYLTERLELEELPQDAIAWRAVSLAWMSLVTQCNIIYTNIHARYS